jgi:hypothetical protein
MQLPSAATRSALKLKDSAQRLIYATMLLEQGLWAHPAIGDNPAQNIAKRTARRGLKAEYVVNPDKKQAYGLVWSVGLESLDVTGWDWIKVDARLPYIPSLRGQGHPLLNCIGTITDDAPLPLVIPVPEGENIEDNSLSTTVEQYWFEQYLAFREDAKSHENNPLGQLADATQWQYKTQFASEYSAKAKVDDQNVDDYNYRVYPIVLCECKIPRIPLSKGTDGLVNSWKGKIASTGDIPTYSPYDVCTATNFYAYKAALS